MASEDTPGTAGSEIHPETPQPAPQPEAAERREISVRRAPKYVPFLILGGLVGMVAAAAVAFGLEGNESYDPNSIFGFFLILFGAGGIILGTVAALLLDRLSVRRAEHAVVEAVPENGPENTPGTAPGALPNAEPGTEPDTYTGTDRGTDTGTDIGAEGQRSAESGTEPGTDGGTDGQTDRKS
jgi:hypothetical protein